MRTKAPQIHQGFIALTSLLILSSVMTLLMISSSGDWVYATDTYNRRHQALREYYAARSCLEEAALRHFQDLSYSGNEIIQAEDFSCAIASFTISSTQVKLSIKIHGVFGDTTLSGTWDPEGNLVSFFKIPNS